MKDCLEMKEAASVLVEVQRLLSIYELQFGIDDLSTK